MAQEIVYAYTARNKKNGKEQGSVQAASVSAAKTILRSRGFTDIKLSTSKASTSSQRINSTDITIFFRQIATMLTSGVSLLQALNIILEGVKKQSFANLITLVKNDVETGIPLSKALSKHKEYFDELICNLVAASEMSGAMDVILNRIAEYQEKTETLKNKVKKAMYYPIAVIVIAIIVTAILLIKVVPTFQDLFKGFGAELPAFTQFVVDISNAIQHHGIKILIVTVFCGWSLMRAYKTSKRFKDFIQTKSLKMPIFGSIIVKSIIARFTRTLATTFAAGVSITESLALLAKSANNVIYVNAILQIKADVESGQKVNIAMRNSQVFPSIVVQMIAIGEESGKLDFMLNKVANIYEEEVNAAVDGLTSLIEPLIMMFLGVVIGGLVVAMYLPVFKMGSVM